MEDIGRLNDVELLLKLTFTELAQENSDRTSALVDEAKRRGLAFSEQVQSSPIGRFEFSLGPLSIGQLEALNKGLTGRGDLDRFGLRHAVLAEYEKRQ